MNSVWCHYAKVLIVTACLFYCIQFCAVSPWYRSVCYRKLLLSQSILNCVTKPKFCVTVTESFSYCNEFCKVSPCKSSDCCRKLLLLQLILWGVTDYVQVLIVMESVCKLYCNFCYCNHFSEKFYVMDKTLSGELVYADRLCCEVPPHQSSDCY